MRERDHGKNGLNEGLVNPRVTVFQGSGTKSFMTKGGWGRGINGRINVRERGRDIASG